MVQRYSLNECASTGMEHDDYGDYVLFEGYDNLCREYDDLKDKYDKLIEKIGDLYREG